MKDNNVFQILKEKFIPDLEFIFEYASAITEKILDKFPDIKYESMNTCNIGIIMKTGKYEFYADIIDCDYDTGAPRIHVSLDYLKPTGGKNMYISNEIASGRTYACRIASACITKYTRNINTWNKKELGPEELAMLDWFIDAVSSVNEEINKLKNTDVPINVQPWKPLRYKEYEDD